MTEPPGWRRLGSGRSKRLSWNARLRRSDLQARVADRDGDGVPERVTWLDPTGRVVQSWTDRDGDGIADRVELYRDGLPVQVIGR